MRARGSLDRLARGAVVQRYARFEKYETDRVAVEGGNIRIDFRRGRGRIGAGSRPSGTTGALEVKTGLCLKNCNHIADVDVRFVLLPFIRGERAFITFVGKLLDTRLNHRVGTNIEQRAGALGIETAAERLQ